MAYFLVNPLIFHILSNNQFFGTLLALDKRFPCTCIVALFKISSDMVTRQAAMAAGSISGIPGLGANYEEGFYIFFDSGSLWF
jgi:hypothetical protein